MVVSEVIMYLSKRKGIYYVFYRKSDGKKTCKSTGSKFKKEALAYLKDFEQKLFEQKKRKKILLSEFKKEYLIHISRTHTDKSISAAKQAFKQFEKYLKKDLYLFDITNRNAEEFILTRYKTAKYSASLYRRNLSAALNVAVKWNYLESNVFSQIKIPTIPKNYPSIITEEQLYKILQTEQNSTLRTIYKTAFYTCCRLSELINIHWQDLDVEKKELIIKNKESFTVKNKKQKNIPLTNKIFFDLIEFKEKAMEKRTGLLFEFKGRRFNPSYVSKAFKKCCRKLELDEGIHFHSLRHSGISHLVSKGANINVVKEIAGHENISTTMIYVTIDNKSKVEVISLFD